MAYAVRNKQQFLLVAATDATDATDATAAGSNSLSFANFQCAETAFERASNGRMKYVKQKPHEYTLFSF